jgi:hypothetical protein
MHSVVAWPDQQPHVACKYWWRRRLPARLGPDGTRGRVPPEGAQLLVNGSEVEDDGQRWYPIRTMDDNPDRQDQVIYAAATEPERQPAAPQGVPEQVCSPLQSDAPAPGSTSFRN